MLVLNIWMTITLFSPLLLNNFVGSLLTFWYLKDKLVINLMDTNFVTLVFNMFFNKSMLYFLLLKKNIDPRTNPILIGFG